MVPVGASSTWVASVLRLAAIALVIVGFLGSVSTDSVPVVTISAYSVLFWIGVACAVVSIYLGIFLQGVD